MSKNKKELKYTIEEMERMYWEEDVKISTIAVDCDVTPETIYNRFREHGINFKGRKGKPYGINAGKLIAKDVLIEVYLDEKLTYNEIIEKLETTQYYLQRSLAIHGIDPNRRSPRPGGQKRIEMDPEELRRMYWDENMTLSGIGRIYGTCPGTIKARLTDYGIPTRSRKEASRKFHDRNQHVYIPLDKDKLTELCNQNLTQGEIIQRMNTTIHHFKKSMGIHGIEKPKFKVVTKGVRTPLDEQLQIVEAYKNGDSMKICARRHGITDGTVRKILKAHKVKTRSISEARKIAWKRYHDQKKVAEVPEPVGEVEKSVEEQILELRNDPDMMVQDIADRLNLSRVDVANVIFGQIQ